MRKGIDVESVVQQIFKKTLLVILGSGLVGNALYIYGLAYYEGYIKALGLDVLLFPIEWSEARLWTYFASRELGVSTVNVWMKFTSSFMPAVMIAAYVVVRLWIALNGPAKKVRPKLSRVKRLRKLVAFGRKWPVVYKVTKWLMIKEQAFWGFIASYFALVFMVFVPLFLLVWVLFPAVGVSHGKYVGKSLMSFYEKNLCGDESDYWNRCVPIRTAHLEDESLPEKINVRIIAASGDLYGLMTKDGPVVMTKPPVIYYLNAKRECAGKVCSNSEAPNE